MSQLSYHTSPYVQYAARDISVSQTVSYVDTPNISDKTTDPLLL